MSLWEPTSLPSRASWELTREASVVDKRLHTPCCRRLNRAGSTHSDLSIRLYQASCSSSKSLSEDSLRTRDPRPSDFLTICNRSHLRTMHRSASASKPLSRHRFRLAVSPRSDVFVTGWREFSTSLRRFSLSTRILRRRFSYPHDNIAPGR